MKTRLAVTLGLTMLVNSVFAETVYVSARANPWLAGMTNGSAARRGDSAPDESPVFISTAIEGGVVYAFSASGSANHGSTLPFFPPDGEDLISHYLGAENGIADITAPFVSLVGVFLGPAQPDQSVAPQPLDFRTSAAQDYVVLAPGLKQPFFIGDGKTSSGEGQYVIAPPGATRLFLGVMDQYQWSDNEGGFKVQITRASSAPPVQLALHPSSNQTTAEAASATFPRSLASAASLELQASILAGPVTNPSNGHIYYLLPKNTWSNAEAQAVSLGGHLATIRNKAENDWVFSTFGSYGGALWIGLTDRQKALQFTWTSGEPVTYTNWGGGQPDNCNGVEFYTHMLPRGHYAAGQWNDYENAQTVLAEQFPLYGVAEILPPKNGQLPLPSLWNPSESPTLASSTTAAVPDPELHAFTAIELTWASEANKVYQVQWTPSMDQPHWENLGAPMNGTGTVLSAFDSTRQHPQAFYRVLVVQ